MSTRLTNFFAVRRDSSRASVKRSKNVLDEPEVQAKLLKPRVSSSSTGSAVFPTSTSSSSKIVNDVPVGVPHQKNEFENVTTLSAATESNPKRRKLPAHKRFAYLAQNETDKLTDVTESSTIIKSTLRDAEPDNGFSQQDQNINAKESYGEHSFKVETTIPETPETSSFGSLHCVASNKSAACSQNSAVIGLLHHGTPTKELQALTKSVSQPSTPNKEASIGIKQVASIAKKAKTDVLTLSPVSPALHLPYHMERLLELFRTCETIVSTLHNRSEVCSFDKIKPAVQEVVRCEFTEETVGKFAAVYPQAYKFRYDNQLDKLTKLVLSTYTLVLVPNLRTDNTQMARDSPSKGHLVFTGTRLIQRRHIFHKSLLARVLKAHRVGLRFYFWDLLV
uniref:CDT1 domain-containing protein n=1 Tax=Mesocestoides corti TaxID=53468 RepID=A0A5K3FR38_MESCO